MNFSNLILLARQRVHDARTRLGAFITDASVDGIRWSSANLASLCRGAISELYRDLLSIKDCKNIAKDLLYQIVQVTLGADGKVTGLDEVNFTKILKITAPTLEGTNPKIYTFIDQEAFFSERYNTRTIDSEILIEDYVFTVIYNLTDKKKEVRFLPFPSEEIENCEAIVNVPLNSLLTLESSDELPFVDTEDLILDYCEREMRKRNAETALVKELDAAINRKLEKLDNGLQSNRR
jgi:hypothetical protein